MDVNEEIFNRRWTQMDADEEVLMRKAGRQEGRKAGKQEDASWVALTCRG